MLNVNELAGFGAGGGGARAVLTDQRVSNADQTTYTFSGVAFGPVGGRSAVVVGVGGEIGSNRSIVSVSIGGVAASQVVGIGSSNAPAGLWRAEGVDVESGVVGVTFSSAMQSCGIGVWGVYDAINAAPGAVASQGASSASSVGTTIATQPESCVIAYCMVRAGSARTFTWTGVVKDFEAVVDDTQDNHSGGTFHATQEEAARPVSVALNDTGNVLSLVAAAWR